MAARVLVIDDSPMTVQLISEALIAAGISVDNASDLAILDERLNSNTYELVLVDVNMPEMFGDDVVEFLRSQRKLTARLLLYSDLPEDELLQKTKDSGADGYVAKSQGLEATVETIRDALDGPQLRTHRVLVVDDNEPSVRLLKAELEAKGHEVMTANGTDAATKIILKKKTRPDLVLLDVNMPGVNGEELCRFIKANSLFSGIQVVFCGTAEDAELQRQVKSCGADGHVRKNQLLAKEILDRLT